MSQRIFKVKDLQIPLQVCFVAVALIIVCLLPIILQLSGLLPVFEETSFLLTWGAIITVLMALLLIDYASIYEQGKKFEKELLCLKKTTSLQVLDRKTLTELKNMMGSTFVFVITKYLETGRKTLEVLEQAIEDRNYSEITMKAHSLKSSCAQVGAMSFSKLCQQLELLSEKDSLESARSLYHEMEREYNAVSELLSMETS